MGSELIDSVTISKPKSSSSAGKCFPPGFRFHPTDEELVLYYLKRKICRRSLKLNIIGEVDVYKWDPEELPGQSKLKTGDRQWFFFSPRDRKYPNGGRTSRATLNGYWKATGKDRIIKRKSSSVGIKKTLVYYQGRAPSGLRTDWVMHEYTLDEQELKRCPLAQEHYVLYKVFKKSGPGPKNGEQYGAVFVEEAWNDEDCLDVDSLLVQKPNPVPLTEAEKTNTREEEEGLGLSDDIVEFLKKVIEEPENLPPEPDSLKKNENSLLVGSSSQVEKDFLEMDDLIGTVTGNGNLVTDFGSFSEFDFYNMENLEYGPGPENSGLVGEGVNHDYVLHDELPISFDIWNHYNQVDSSTMTSQTVLETVSIPSTGVVVEENPAKPENHPDQCAENMENDSDSLFSSALWAFVDSIPTTPASASESNALVNRAFERMSSFSRGRNVDLAAVAASGTTTRRLEKSKPSSRSRGIVFYSVLGVLFAMLWVFVGSSMELLKRSVWL